MKILVVAAHPDDEALGCGGTIAALAGAGVYIKTCILSGEAEARQMRPETSELMRHIEEAHEILGVVEPPIIGRFPNIRFNTVPHLEMVQFIESAILESGADVILAHHPGDLNDDNVVAARACQAACRLFQRRQGVPRLNALYFYEVLSSTDWAFPSGGTAFQPTAFFPVGETLEKKIKALRAYKGVVREFPHPRSEEVLRSLAVFRGGQSGLPHAEAFQVAFQVLTPDGLAR
jgi:LmbE family N-acetylglucosaminyl deacetylase